MGGSEGGRPAAAVSRGRRVAATVLGFVFAAGALGGLFGVGLVIGWFDQDAGGIHRVHDLGFGVLFGILLTVALVAIALRPGRWPSAFAQILALAAGSLISGAVSENAAYLSIGAVVLVVAAILWLLVPIRTGEAARGRFSAPIAAVAILGAIPLVWFALTAARLQRTGPAGDPHVQMNHWATMAAMAFALVLCGLLAAGRLRGWRITAWSAGLGSFVYGVASMVFHDFAGTGLPYPGSEGLWWGLVAAVGGLAFVALAEAVARRAPPG